MESDRKWKYATPPGRGPTRPQRTSNSPSDAPSEDPGLPEFITPKTPRSCPINRAAAPPRARRDGAFFVHARQLLSAGLLEFDKKCAARESARARPLLGAAVAPGRPAQNKPGPKICENVFKHPLIWSVTILFKGPVLKLN